MHQSCKITLKKQKRKETKIVLCGTWHLSSDYGYGNKRKKWKICIVLRTIKKTKNKIILREYQNNVQYAFKKYFQQVFSKIWIVVWLLFLKNIFNFL